MDDREPNGPSHIPIDLSLWTPMFEFQILFICHESLLFFCFFPPKTFENVKNTSTKIGDGLGYSNPNSASSNNPTVTYCQGCIP